MIFLVNNDLTEILAWERRNMIVKAESKPRSIEAFKWENNEPYLRDWIKDDSLIHFNGNMLEIWNSEIRDWVSVPMFFWIIKGIKGEFYPISSEVFEQLYQIIE